MLKDINIQKDYKKMELLILEIDCNTKLIY